MRHLHPARRRRQRRAVAATECALVMPLLVILLLGLWELGRAIQVYQTVSNAAREGARQAASAKYTSNQVREAVFAYLRNARVPLSDSLDADEVTLLNTNATITAINLTKNGDTFEGDQLDEMQVTVTVPVKNFRWLLTSFFMPSEAKVTAISGFLCTADVPIVIPQSIPQQPLP